MKRDGGKEKAATADEIDRKAYGRLERECLI